VRVFELLGGFAQTLDDRVRGLFALVRTTSDGMTSRLARQFVDVGQGLCNQGPKAMTMNVKINKICVATDFSELAAHSFRGVENALCRFYPGIAAYCPTYTIASSVVGSIS
jgi:hypothetical protein